MYHRGDLLNERMQAYRSADCGSWLYVLARNRHLAFPRCHRLCFQAPADRWENVLLDLDATGCLHLQVLEQSRRRFVLVAFAAVLRMYMIDLNMERPISILVLYSRQAMVSGNIRRPC